MPDDTPKAPPIPPEDAARAAAAAGRFGQAWLCLFGGPVGLLPHMGLVVSALGRLGRTGPPAAPPTGTGRLRALWIAPQILLAAPCLVLGFDALPLALLLAACVAGLPATVLVLRRWAVFFDTDDARAALHRAERFVAFVIVPFVGVNLAAFVAPRGTIPRHVDRELLLGIAGVAASQMFAIVMEQTFGQFEEMWSALAGEEARGETIGPEAPTDAPKGDVSETEVEADGVSSEKRRPFERNRPKRDWREKWGPPPK